MPPKVRQIVRLLKKSGLRYKNTEGSHHHFVDPQTGEKFTIAGNPSKEVSVSTWLAVQKFLKNRRS
jgi:predicted RNA binding protein YcfA (HicA-like mRNA interferase family)